MKRLLAASVMGLGLLCSAAPSWAQSIEAAVLPSSRSTIVGKPVTAFATIANTGSAVANGCAISTAQPNVKLTYQTTDPKTNQLTGSANGATASRIGSG